MSKIIDIVRTGKSGPRYRDSILQECLDSIFAYELFKGVFHSNKNLREVEVFDGCEQIFEGLLSSRWGFSIVYGRGSGVYDLDEVVRNSLQGYQKYPDFPKGMLKFGMTEIATSSNAHLTTHQVIVIAENGAATFHDIQVSGLVNGQWRLLARILPIK